MMKQLGCTAAIVAVMGMAQSATAQTARPLTQSELSATQMSENWRNGANMVSMGDDGKVVFVYGQAQPTIVCAELRLCDLELQPGETVMNVHVGDSVRWKFDGARSGPGGNTPHILIKPVESNIETSLVITTDRRTYHMHLKSDRHAYMARMAFDYSSEPMNFSMMLETMRADPAPIVEVVEAETVEVVEPMAAPVVTSSQIVEALDFNYEVKGKAKWKPLRVFNDGLKTYIEMPERMKQTEAPVLLVIGPDKKENIVNYRLRDGRYIVDQVFERAILQAGVGKARDRIKIHYKGA